MADDAHSNSLPRRKYDKGERRFKHVGKTAEPVFEYDARRPRYWIGKCPNVFAAADHERLLDEAIGATDEDSELSFPKRLYVVERGAIYRAETTDWGKSYHGYPYRGKLGKRLIAALRAMALRKGCVPDFEDWLCEYIEESGS